MRVAIIPARGGSKRIPRKNIRDFDGRPVIAHSIEAARVCELFDRVIVSTDDREIGEVARNHGAETPFVRPEQLADDHAGTTEVVAHAVRWLQENDERPVDAVCCIYPTAPLIRADDIRAAYDLIASGEWLFVFPATGFAAPVYRSFLLQSDGGVRMLWPENFGARSQDLEEPLHDAGQFYWGTPDAWLSGRPIFAEHSTIVRIPRWLAQDIDTEEDWRHAELIAKAMRAP